MANGNGNGGLSLTPAKVLGYAITFTVALNSVVLWAINDMDRELEQRTALRYTSLDADKDLKLRDFRMHTIENRVNECLHFIQEHERNDHNRFQSK